MEISGAEEEEVWRENEREERQVAGERCAADTHAMSRDCWSQQPEQTTIIARLKHL